MAVHASQYQPPVKKNIARWGLTEAYLEKVYKNEINQVDPIKKSSFIKLCEKCV
jgi:hypothetical protein